MGKTQEQVWKYKHQFNREGRKWGQVGLHKFIIVSTCFVCLRYFIKSNKQNQNNFQCCELAPNSIFCKLFYSVLFAAYCFQRRLSALSLVTQSVFNLNLMTRTPLCLGEAKYLLPVSKSEQELLPTL